MLPSTEPKPQQLDGPVLTPIDEDCPPGSVAIDSTQHSRLRRVSGGLSPKVGSDVLSTPPDEGDVFRDRSNSVPHQTATLPPLTDSQTLKSRRKTIPILSEGPSAARKDIFKLSPGEIQELTSSPESVPFRRLPSYGEDEEEVDESPSIPPGPHERSAISTRVDDTELNGWEDDKHGEDKDSATRLGIGHQLHEQGRRATLAPTVVNGTRHQVGGLDQRPTSRSIAGLLPFTRRNSNERPSRPRLPAALSFPPQPDTARDAYSENHRVLNSSSKHVVGNGTVEPPSDSERYKTRTKAQLPSPPPSPVSDSIPLPPLSIPTHLHLELSNNRPSPLYISHSFSTDTPYEPSRVKFERLMNFVVLPPQLERVLLFGALTCLDAWLYTFTILPLRFFKALGILMGWLAVSAWTESKSLANFVYEGAGRVWHRRKRKLRGAPREASISTASSTATDHINQEQRPRHMNGGSVYGPQTVRSREYPRRKRSVPSLLEANHKADLLQGLLIICSCMILMRFDASRMYHGIRGQAAIKLYVIYNVLEVCDRLASALGQDIIECLFSPETLDRKGNGRSKTLRPFVMFIAALIYTVCHATAFFYQVITLNVAINSYSNALLTLLMSNQFVEIKGTVFKKFEKENLFQLTCADVVERFQLWLMLLIIVLRNIVELGGLSLGSSPVDTPSTSNPPHPNITNPATASRTFSILPDSFTLLPSPAQLQLLTPFLLVLGSEMAVDWLKHAYITKFNATSPRIYSRYYDVLAKDYYSHAFGPQNLVRRLGLPVIPLACLFIRAMLQTYHMFLATNVSASSPPLRMQATGTNLASPLEASASPALAQIDAIFRNALGRSSFGGGSTSARKARAGSWYGTWSVDDVIALTTMLVFFLAVYLLLLAFKLVLGMVLLSVARNRVVEMQKREGVRGRESEGKGYVERDARRVGPGGVVEVGEERRSVIYEGDVVGLKALKEKERKSREKEDRVARSGNGGGDRLESVERYAMVAKRIW